MDGLDGRLELVAAHALERYRRPVPFRFFHHQSLVSVPVMDIWKVRMRVDQLLVVMSVAMGFSGRIEWTMRVLVMLVMHVQMVVVQRLVPM